MEKKRFDKAKSHGKIDVSSSTEFVRDGSIKHNYSALLQLPSVERTNRLIRPLCAIDKIFFNVYIRHDPKSDDVIGQTIVIFDVCKKGGNDGNQ